MVNNDTLYIFLFNKLHEGLYEDHFVLTVTVVIIITLENKGSSIKNKLRNRIRV